MISNLASSICAIQGFSTSMSGNLSRSATLDVAPSSNMQYSHSFDPAPMQFLLLLRFMISSSWVYEGAFSPKASLGLITRCSFYFSTLSALFRSSLHFVRFGSSCDVFSLVYGSSRSSVLSWFKQSRTRWTSQVSLASASCSSALLLFSSSAQWNFIYGLQHPWSTIRDMQHQHAVFFIWRCHGLKTML